MSNQRPRLALPTFLPLLVLALLPFRALGEEYSSPSDGIRSMRYEAGLLSLETHDAQLEKVLSELSRMAMITIISDGPIEGRITLYADRLPLEKALRKILRGKDTSFVYSAVAETSPRRYEVKEVRIYSAEAEKGEGRRYSYANRGRQETARPSRSPARGARRKRSDIPVPKRSPRIPDMASREDAQQLISDLMEGNFDGLNEIAEKLKEEDPQVKEKIDEFMENLEEARIMAEESGEPIRGLQGLGDMKRLMQKLNRRRRSPDVSEPDE